MQTVKPRRRYDSTARRRQAEQTREVVLETARAMFLQSGYSATTVPSIARAAGVSTETIYKAFGAKPGLVRALWERSILGREPVPAPERSDALSAAATDPAQLLRAWAQFVKELGPQGSPIQLLIRDAATADTTMAALLTELDERRRERMRLNATRLQDKGWVKPGLTLEQITDILWLHCSPELYELLVVKSGWSLDAFGEYVGEAMIAALLPRSDDV